MVRYNVVGGKAHRPLLTRLTMEAVLGRPLVDDEVHAANVVGWACEIIQGLALIVDDIMDNGSTRRGKECWYKKVGVARATNDALSLFSLVYKILARELPDELYVAISKLLTDTCVHTGIGQTMDCDAEGSVDKMTKARYDKIVHFKTTFYTFEFPIVAGILLCDLAHEEELTRQARVASRVMGRMFQVQDDYLDCFGNPAITGKVGTDLGDGKCTWMIIHAMATADDAQRAELRASYGHAAGAARVKELFDTLGMHAEYRREQAQSEEDLHAEHPALQTLFLSIVSELMNREV